MNKIIKTNPMQKGKSKFRKKVCKRVYRYPKNIYFLTEDDIFCHSTQIYEAFLRKRIMKHYLLRLKKEGYISSRGYDVLKKHRNWQEGCTVYIAGKIKLRKQDITSILCVKRKSNQKISTV